MTGNWDIVVLQYNYTGSLLWTKQTGTCRDDRSHGVSASGDGKYIYVTGYAGASLNGQPYEGDVLV